MLLSSTKFKMKNAFEDIRQSYTDRGYKVPKIDSGCNIFENRPEIEENQTITTCNWLNTDSLLKADLYLAKMKIATTDSKEIREERKRLKESEKWYNTAKGEKIKEKIRTETKEISELRSNLDETEKKESDMTIKLRRLANHTQSSSKESAFKIVPNKMKKRKISRNKELKSTERSRVEKRTSRKAYFRSSKKLSLLQAQVIKHIKDVKEEEKPQEGEDKITFFKRRVDRMMSINKTTRFKKDADGNITKIRQAKDFYEKKMSNVKKSNVLLMNFFMRFGKKLLESSITKIKERDLIKVFHKATSTNFEEMDDIIAEYFADHNKSLSEKSKREFDPFKVK